MPGAIWSATAARSPGGECVAAKKVARNVKEMTMRACSSLRLGPNAPLDVDSKGRMTPSMTSLAKETFSEWTVCAMLYIYPQWCVRNFDASHILAYMLSMAL